VITLHSYSLKRSSIVNYRENDPYEITRLLGASTFIAGGEKSFHGHFERSDKSVRKSKKKVAKVIAEAAPAYSISPTGVILKFET
jgi:hypothetical protein